MWSLQVGVATSQGWRKVGVVCHRVGRCPGKKMATSNHMTITSSNFSTPLQCSNNCGYGKATRNIHCRVWGGTKKVYKSHCAGLEKPPSQQDCWDDRGVGCMPYWFYGPYGEVR